MIVELRTYTTHPGKVAEYLSLYDREGRAIQMRYLERLVGYYRTEVGPLNQVVHMWAYSSLDDRAGRRDRMSADPDWRAYVAKMLPLLVSQESKLLLPAPFFTPSWTGPETPSR